MIKLNISNEGVGRDGCCATKVMSWAGHGIICGYSARDAQPISNHEETGKTKIRNYILETANIINTNKGCRNVLN